MRQPPKKAFAQYKRWLRENLRREYRPRTDAEQLELLKRLSRNELTPDDRDYLGRELQRLWFPKELTAQQRDLGHIVMACTCLLKIKEVAAETGSVSDAKREVAKELGLQSIEAMEELIKRAKRLARGRDNNFQLQLRDQLGSIEKRIREKTPGYKKP
jgi:hypothetical protein